MNLSAEEARRYARQLSLPDFGLEQQIALKESKVLVIGAGGLGSPILTYLAAAGVGTIGVVDYDSVSLSNLHRQVLHAGAEIGDLKVESAQKYIQQLNPNVSVLVHPAKLTSENVLDIFANYDVVVDGSDNFPTRYLVNDAAVKLQKPLVWGSVFQSDGQLAVFNYAGRACYRCIFPRPPRPGEVANCSIAGVLGALCGVVGSAMAIETVKVLLNSPSVISDFINYSSEFVELRHTKMNKNSDCPVCSLAPSTIQLYPDYVEYCGDVETINPTELQSEMSKSGIVLVDVRTPDEFASGSINGSFNLDSRVFDQEFVGVFQDPSARIILFCEAGSRSLQCALILKGAGFSNVAHLEGGMTNWRTV